MNTSFSTPILAGYDPASHNGDISALCFWKNGVVIGRLYGDAADYVNRVLIQLDAELKEKRDNDND